MRTFVAAGTATGVNFPLPLVGTDGGALGLIAGAVLVVESSGPEAPVVVGVDDPVFWVEDATGRDAMVGTATLAVARALCALPCKR